MRLLTLTLLFVSIVSLVRHASAGTLYVNNRLGNDRYNGKLAEGINEVTGPVRTITRALKLAGPSDVISLANTGVPYYEAVCLIGIDNSGTPVRPFVILGNGATLSGAIGIPETGWQQAGDDLWRLNPYRKGHYQLILDGKALPEVVRGADETWKEVPDLAVGSWCAFKGSVYYKAEHLTEPESMNFGLAQKGCGITLYGVKNVMVRDLNVQHFRIDGVNANDRAQDVVLRNVAILENGRAGLTVSGTSTVAVQRSVIERNRKHSILIKEAAALILDEAKLDQQPDEK